MDSRSTQAEEMLGYLSLMPDVLFKCVKRADGKIVFTFNEGALAKEFHVTTAEVQGKTFEEMFPPPMVQANLPHFEAAFRGETSEFVSELGGRYFRHYPAPVRGPDGKVEAVVGFIAEVTAVKRAEAEIRLLNTQLEQRVAELAEANRGLDEANRARAQFVSAVSHELNNAMTPLHLQLHVLKAKRASLEPRQRDAVDILERNLKRANLLVEDLLDAARLQAGGLRLNPQPVDLNRLIQEAVESFAETAKAAGVNLRMDLAPDVHLEADPRRVTQVLFNLLGNALKFTPRGGKVTVSTNVAGDSVQVLVHDTGQGIAAEGLVRLFKPFSQVHDVSKGAKGTGLGLYICKGIVEQHGGRIWAGSEGPGRGALFTFELPLAAPEAMPAASMDEGAGMGEDVAPSFIGERARRAAVG